MRKKSAFIFVSLISCGHQETSTIKKVIDNPDFIRVDDNGSNIPEKFKPLLDAFGLMSMGCTGTHIGNSLILTAGHCFRSASEAEAICKRTTIDFGFRGDAAPYLTSRCTKVIVIEVSDTKDYALFQIADVPRSQVEIERSNSKLHSAVTIFSFPSWRPLEWSQYCALSESKVIYENLVADFTHQCDTEPVSSGSAVIDAQTLKIVGIHDGGYLPWNYGTLVSQTELLINAIPQ